MATHKTKQAALKAARAVLGAEAIETVDFNLHNTGAGWEYAAIPPATDAAVKSQAKRVKPKAAATAKKRAAAKGGAAPKESREERRLRKIREADERNAARAAAPKVAPEPRSPKPKAAKPATPERNKTETVLEMLAGVGATSKQLEEATGWMPHSVRGLLGTLRKKGVNIVASKEKGQPTVYRIPADKRRAAAASDVGDVV